MAVSCSCTRIGGGGLEDSDVKSVRFQSRLTGSHGWSMI
jgi:hypothetical protein